MKKTLILFITFISQVFAQNTVEITEKSHTLLYYDELQTRYWEYRQRFFEKFIFPTPETEWLENMTAGQYCVVSSRSENFIDEEYFPNGIKNLNNEKTLLKFGDQTMFLGQFIGSMAMEYRLLRNSGKAETDPQVINSIRHLCGGLLAYRRLDIAADNSFNGFFVRDDVPNGFPDANQYFTKSDFIDCFNVQKCDCNNVSLDQIIGIFQGLALVIRLVPPSVQYEVGPGHFLSPHEFAKEIMSLITIWYRNGGQNSTDPWQIYDPIKNCVIWKEATFSAWPIAAIAEEFTGDCFQGTGSTSIEGLVPWIFAQYFYARNRADGQTHPANGPLQGKYDPIFKTYNSRMLMDMAAMNNRFSTYNNAEMFTAMVLAVTIAGAGSVFSAVIPNIVELIAYATTLTATGPPVFVPPPLGWLPLASIPIIFAASKYGLWDNGSCSGGFPKNNDTRNLLKRIIYTQDFGFHTELLHFVLHPQTGKPDLDSENRSRNWLLSAPCEGPSVNGTYRWWNFGNTVAANYVSTLENRGVNWDQNPTDGWAVGFYFSGLDYLYWHNLHQLSFNPNAPFGNPGQTQTAVANYPIISAQVFNYPPPEKDKILRIKAEGTSNFPAIAYSKSQVQISGILKTKPYTNNVFQVNETFHGGLIVKSPDIILTNFQVDRNSVFETGILECNPITHEFQKTAPITESFDEENQFDSPEISENLEEETQAKADKQPSLRIYPNPFGTELSIQSETELLEVWLTDLYGRKIISSNSLQTNTYTLSTQVLSSGCYILHLRTEKGISTHKVCKE